jgi:hypothetical protein
MIVKINWLDVKIWRQNLSEQLSYDAAAKKVE